MELNTLRYFYEVAKDGSFTKASKRLKISQPALSKMVKKLESQESLVLLERNKKGVTLTEQGKMCFEKCKLIFEEIDSLKQSLTHNQTIQTGHVFFGASDNLSNHILPKLFLKFWKKYPNVKINHFVGTSQIIQNELLQSNVDLGMFFTKPHHLNLKFQVIGQAEFVIVFSSKNKRLRVLKTLDKRALEESYFIGSRAFDYQGPYPVLKLLKSLEINPNLFFETNNQETQKKMILQEYGFSVLPKFMVQEELDTKKLLTLPTPQPLLKPIYLVQKQNRPISKATQIFKDYLISEFSHQIR